MADLKDLLPLSKSLSLLYIDENQEFLTTITTVLKKVFSSVDDASDAVVGISYLKVHDYDLVVVDSSSAIMSTDNLIKKIKESNPNQEIILTTTQKTEDELLGFYGLNISALQIKPFKTSVFLDTVFQILQKLHHHRAYLNPQIEKINNDLLYERKRIGRFMMNEKTLNQQIESYKDSVHINKYIYELTKLPSRFALQDALDGTVQSLLYINIDHFDFVNTTYGMGKANKLLKGTALKLKQFLPTNTNLYHVTADEFVLLLNEPSQNQAMLLASQIQSFFKESVVEFDGHSHSVVFSIGIDNGEGNKLFINAKAASKEARHYGGNTIVTYDVHSQYMTEKRDGLYWIGVLQKAFDDDKIFTYYQPIVSNNVTQTKHYEVLCRLMDQNNKLVDANKFIRSAKQVGFITQITRIVIDKAFKLFEKNDYNFSINISMHDLHENYLLKFLNYKCEHYHISPTRVHLELVEDIIISKTDMLDTQVLELKNNGYHVIVDDFGTDKSAYNRMFELKAEYIKIDGTFIKELGKDRAFRVIVKSIVDFAKKSGIKTIAEHVESEEIHTIVKELGIDYSQGYYIGKPSLNI
ncbi:GGDEF domain-containing response regulator [Sulfurimonas sp. SAG-AH-194-C20]|nr:GGDEF domain-containing response regulator [Sulfurimonas sp. SAG-AH-194-C20]MDF1879276.1 GGDEF domain-containing response regulator [Sulfurimonas sp. SAG-AH-194-C20]